MAPRHPCLRWAPSRGWRSRCREAPPAPPQTTGRVREAIFNILGDAYLPAVRVADLFAGSGALGIEAMSRGASNATFIDASGAAWQTR